MPQTQRGIKDTSHDLLSSVFKGGDDNSKWLISPSAFNHCQNYKKEVISFCNMKKEIFFWSKTT